LLADWRSVARSAGYRVSANNTITVALEGGNKQTITLQEIDTGIALRAYSIIAKAKVLRDVASDNSPWRYAWERNRLSDLFGFSVDSRGRLIGETWIPLEGLDAEELALYVQELARICDWHEFRLAGEDIY
jgi:hypothetical protein